MIELDLILDRLVIVSGDMDKTWSKVDDEFLRDNLGFMEESEIAKTLGRTVVAVHLRWKRDLRLPAPSKDPRYITGNQLAEVLGVDGHTAVWWIDSGLLPGERLPGKRLIRRVSKVDLLEWVLYPDNWVYFHPDRVRDPNLYRLIERARQGWNDEWWTTRQAADYLGVDPPCILRNIEFGRIRGRRVPGRSGRHPSPYWANWFVLRSEIIRPDLYIPHRKDYRSP
jgi:hypothetical protein